MGAIVPVGTIASGLATARGTWRTLSQVRPVALVLSVLLMGLALWLGVVRWRMVWPPRGLICPLARATRISLVAQFFNSFLLGSTGGDLIKAYYAARETHHLKTEAVTTVFVDRLARLVGHAAFRRHDDAAQLANAYASW